MNNKIFTTKQLHSNPRKVLNSSLNQPVEIKKDGKIIVIMLSNEKYKELLLKKENNKISN